MQFKNLLALLPLLALHPDSGETTTEWKPVSKKDGIAVFTRYTEDSDFKHVRIMTQIETTLQTIVSMLEDVPNFTSWVYGCLEAKLVERVNQEEIYYYTLTDAPWPVSDRDIIMHSVMTYDERKKIIMSKSVAATGILEEKPGVVRVREASSLWIFIEVKNNVVNVVYEISLDPGGSLPAWLMNKAVEIGPYHTIKSMKAELQKEKYNNKKQ